MRSPNSIQVLLRVRRRREEIEEGRLEDINRRMKQVQAEFASLSAELKRITTARLGEIQSSLPNIHHQSVETQSKMLWRRCADCAAEIQRLKDLQTLQMSAYLYAYREREVIENLDKRRSDAFELEKRLREQKLNDDLFLSRTAARWDT